MHVPRHWPQPPYKPLSGIHFDLQGDYKYPTTFDELPIGKVVGLVQQTFDGDTIWEFGHVVGFKRQRVYENGAGWSLLPWPYVVIVKVGDELEEIEFTGILIRA